MEYKSSASRTGAQTAESLARMAKALARIIRAAMAAGLKGVAVAAAKEALPFLVKLAAGILFVCILLPILIFTSLPNIFFGFDSSGTQPIMDMSQKALTIGGAYMSIEDFERMQMDSIVTSLVSEYENDGTSIDEIVVTSHFDQEDLCWLIAINSVAHEQDLNTMSASDIRSLSISRLTYTPSLGSIVTGEGESAVTKTTLEIDFEKLDPDELMEQLGFDDDAQTWAGALFETLSESDALNTYSDYFSPFAPNYGGDTSYSGDIQHGSEYGNEIDISGFSDPDTKNNLDLAAYAVQAWENNWGYVWGTYGCVLTQSLFDYKLEQYPSGVGNYKEFIEENWLGRRTADCVGLIKGYGWLNVEDMTIDYATNGMLDYTANQMYASAEDNKTEFGPMDTMPEIVGLALWKDGHIGVYIGNGYAIEAMGTKYGVVKTEVEGRGWQGWCKIPYINYIEEG